MEDRLPKQIYVGCLPKNVRKEALEEIFGRYGEIKHINIYMEKDELGMSVPSACITCENEAMTRRILAENHMFKSKMLKVRKYLSDEQLQKRVDQTRRCRIYIRRLPSEIDEKKLRDMFRIYGKIASCYCVDAGKHRQGAGRTWQHGYVIFAKEESIRNVPWDGVPYRGNLITWTCYERKKLKRQMVKDEKKKKTTRSKRRVTDRRVDPPRRGIPSQQSQKRQHRPSRHVLRDSRSRYEAKRGDPLRLTDRRRMLMPIPPQRASLRRVENLDEVEFYEDHGQIGHAGYDSSNILYERDYYRYYQQTRRMRPIRRPPIQRNTTITKGIPTWIDIQSYRPTQSRYHRRVELMRNHRRWNLKFNRQAIPNTGSC